MGEKQQGLFHRLVELSGLSHDVVHDELHRIIKRLNLDLNELTTSDIRRVVTVYLYEMHHEQGLADCDESCFCEVQKENQAQA